MLWNFLGTYTSRYSDYNEYWLFGFLVRELADAEFDLLAGAGAGAEGSGDIFDGARDLAVREFDDQLRKAGLDRSHVLDAHLRIMRLSASSQVLYGEERGGWNHRFHARATADTGRTFECETVVFVAPNVPDAWREYSAFERRVRGIRQIPSVQGRLDIDR